MTGGAGVERDHILVSIVRKFGRELQPRSGITKWVTRVVTRRCFRMTTGADGWSCAAEELRAMAAHAGVVIGEVSDVGEGGGLGPVFSRWFVARVAG